ncbi:uncharacterized protein LOC130677850 [Microplitis mediator]|uniref:uncharacterized protein LOC130677850 n=1 Tax=Microplitis mediator TaxID=375433 RepID=UPI002552AEEA|nr:uncharacterized protein LOC130677850 [Microplitis mediator]
MIIYCIEGLLMKRNRVCIGNIGQSVRSIFVNHFKLSQFIANNNSSYKNEFNLNNTHLKSICNYFIERRFSNKKKDFSNISFKSHSSNILSVPLKKRPVRKRKLVFDDGVIPPPGFWSIKALATADEYDLDGLLKELVVQDLYTPKKINTSTK